MANKKAEKVDDVIELDTRTQEVLKQIVNEATVKTDQINAQTKERLSLMITAYVNAKGKEGSYVISEDLTQLIIPEGK